MEASIAFVALWFSLVHSFTSARPFLPLSIFTDKNFAAITKLEEFATKRGHTIGELAIAWLLHRPAVDTVIAGATKPEQVDDNAKGADWKLSKEEMDELDGLLK